MDGHAMNRNQFVDLQRQSYTEIQYRYLQPFWFKTRVARVIESAVRMVKQLSISSLLGVKPSVLQSPPKILGRSASSQSVGTATEPSIASPRRGRCGGRPKSFSSKRGVAGGYKSNKRLQWQQPLRRDPSSPVKLACVAW